MAKPQILVDINSIKQSIVNHENSINTLNNKILKGTGVIQITGWTTVSGDYIKRYSYAITGITSSDVVDICLDKDSIDVAINAEMCPTSESYDGGVYIYAKSIPSATINFSYIVFK